LPPPPPPNTLSSSEHLTNLLKSHRKIVSAVQETLTTDTSNPANTQPADMNLPPPPTPISYDGTAINPETVNDDATPLEWRSTSRHTDIRQAHRDSTKIVHAATLVDVLDTISDLREDIEKMKKEKRQILLNLKKLEKHEGAGGAVAVKARLLQAKKTLDEQVKEMNSMLTQLCDSRKQLMDRGGKKEKKVESESEGESAPSGGLEGLRERRRKRKEKGKENDRVSIADLKREEMEKLKDGNGSGVGEGLQDLWRVSEATSLKSGASAAIATNEDGCPLYHKLLLDIYHPVDVSAQQRETYDFLKQASVPEQIEFICFALNPAMASDLLYIASAFLKIHAHSFKSIKRFKRTVGFMNPSVLELLCCAASEFHVDYLSPVLALLWLFGKIPHNRAVLLRRGVVGGSVARMKRYTDLVKRKGVDKRKGNQACRGDGKVSEQTLCALTMLAGLCFE